MAFTVQSQFWYNGDNSPPIWYKFKFLICDISCLFYATKMIKGLEHLSQGDKVREVVLLIQPKEEKAQGRILSMCINTWKEDVDKDVAKLFSVVASNRARASGHKVTCRKFYLNLRKTLLLWVWAHSPERLWSLYPWRYQKLTGHDPEKPGLGDSALNRIWTRQSSEVLPHSVIIWFCDSGLSQFPRSVFLFHRDTTRGNEGWGA